MIPYVILRQSVGPAANAGNAQTAEKKAYRYALAIEAAWAIVINAFTLHLFLNKPFRWPDSPEWQRFMW
jgi:alpha-1,2-glucosyltransferase